MPQNLLAPNHRQILIDFNISPKLMFRITWYDLELFFNN